ncbi:hypothetical protein BJ508DRAFT_53529 [Ascobolus immersus RN42]|uniref:Rhodopsin domain-containing protein n=1 Tax=Ascobolus immersus RN42 TaxID=1160509 RepID=A0A3N4HUH0_ASCIM|nr:hypothetical protein BJ508DRAFT_53529 [Ascobolus immersus RN42]
MASMDYMMQAMHAILKRDEILEAITVEGNLTRANTDATVAAVPPPMAPNYDHPFESMIDTIHGVNISFTILGCMFVMLRVYSRLRTLGRLGWDDYVISVAAALSIFLCVCVSLSVNIGAGRHWWDIPVEWLTKPQTFPVTYTMVLLYSIIAALVKISVLAFYLRLSPQRPFIWACRATIVFVVLTYIGTLPVLIAPCKPFRASWDFGMQFLPTTKCVDTASLYSAHAVIYVVTDFIIMGLPMPMLFQLQLPLIQKIQAIIVFCCTGIVGMAGIFRCYWLIVGPSYGQDAIWASSHGMVWSSIEINVGIICACLPAVKGFLAKLYPNVFGAQYASKKNSVFTGASGGYNATSKAMRSKQGGTVERGDVEGEQVIMKSIQFKVHVEGDEERGSTNDLLAGVQNPGKSDPRGLEKGSSRNSAPSI